MNVLKAPLRHNRRWLPLALLLVALALYLPTVNKHGVVNDCQAAAASAWRIATTGRPWMDEVKVDRLEGTSKPQQWIVQGADGHLVHNRTPGVILAGVPFYWALDNDPAASGFKIWVGGVAAAALTAAGGLLMFSALRPNVGDVGAVAGTSALLFTTPVWSVSADALWTHSVTILAISGALWAVTRSRWGVAGTFFALGIFARAHLAVIAAVVGLYLGWRRREWGIVLRMGASSLVGLLLLAVWNRFVFGSWSLRGGYGPYVTENLIPGGTSTPLDSLSNVIGFLAAPDRGLLVWTPAILLLLPSMLAWRRQIPDWTRAFVLAGVVYTAVQLQVNSFLGGLGFYGYRHALELLVCLTPALVYAYRATAPATRVVLGALLGAQFAVIAIGAATDTYWVDGDEIWATSAYLVAFTDHPWVYGLITAASSLAAVLLTLAVGRHPRRHEPDRVVERKTC